jgi:hypothetical protein
MSAALAIFTIAHVAISLAGIGSGFIVAFGLLKSKRLDGWTATFLLTTGATSVTGFLFPVHHFMPSHAVGIVALLVLSIALFARYGRNMAGAWRRAYVITAMISLYLNVFVLVAQLFMKVPALKSLALTQSGRPFATAQLTVLALFIVFTVIAVLRFHVEESRPGQSTLRVA